MKPETDSDPKLAQDPSAVLNSGEWTNHEHISEQVQLEAQKLVDLVGSPELAKHAINVVEQRQQE